MNNENKIAQDEVVEDNKKQDVSSDQVEEIVEEVTSLNEDDIKLVDQEDADVVSNIELEQKLEEITNRLLRVQADYDNFRRRTRLERESDAKYRSQPLLEKLLPVLDNFERALMLKAETEEAKSLLQGTEMVYRQLQDALNEEGVEIIETVGKTFDPHLHQAVMTVQEEGKEKDEIVDELQKGYLLRERVIRPSMVRVNS